MLTKILQHQNRKHDIKNSAYASANEIGAGVGAGAGAGAGIWAGIMPAARLKLIQITFTEVTQNKLHIFGHSP